MKKNNIFLKSTLILILGGIITKIIAFIVKTIYIKIVGQEVISLYSLVLPTYSLIITIATMAMPTTISKLIAEKKHKNINIVSTAFFFIMFINLLLMIILLLLSKYISTNLLHENKCYLLLISIAITFPIISVSSIIKGYYYGKQNMIPNALSNIIEEIVRGLLIIILVPKVLKINNVYAGAILFIITFIEEVISIIINLMFLPKKIKINFNDIKPSKYTLNSILDISLPTVSSRLIGNIGYFFEPILLKKLLLIQGYSNKYILLEYGSYNMYTLNILTLPSFFITAIASTLIPEIAKYYKTKDYYHIKKRLITAIKFSLIIGISYEILLLFFDKYILYSLYGTLNGLNYIRFLNIVFPLFYLESIFISFLQSIDKSKITMIITTFGIIIKLLSLIISSFFHIGIYSLLISEIINIIFVVSLNIYFTIKYLNKIKNSSIL